MLACFGITAKAQDTKIEEPKGKAIIQMFENFHSGFGDNKNDIGFELERAYLGYEYYLGKGLSVKGVMDIGKSSDISDLHRVAYMKNALIQWKTGDLTLKGGLISTTQFNFQEKFWGYRYVMKSFQNSENDWNISKDEQAAILGAQFKLGKYVKIAPNFRMSIPKDGSDNSYYAYINCYFGL